MAKEPKNNGKQWSKADLANLNKLAEQNTPTPLIAYKIGRSEGSVRSKASEIDLSLKPTNKSPYNRQK